MRRIVAVLFLLVAAGVSRAHYNMLLPNKAWAQKGEKVTFTYQFGHPFEHELFDAPEPQSVIVIQPDGKHQKIEKLTKIMATGADGKKLTVYTFVYEPAQRGDHTVVLQTPLIWMADTKDFVQDSVKTVLHVQAQKNWDALLPESADKSWTIAPLTRPYGLLPGMVFQAQVYVTRPGKYDFEEHAEFEIERYNTQAPKKLPPDELITFKTKVDSNGTGTFAFPEAGWWSLTATRPFRDPETRKVGNNEGTVRHRATLWVHVNEKK